ncbi:MAG: CbtA family protein [Proteobacteria bacterium]|nr:CbtA family protein [Pseudomonadota bacterium]
MVRTLLVRGMLVGVLAAILSFAFLKLAGEPAVEQAIAFETRQEEAQAATAREEATRKGQPAPLEAVKSEPVSRSTQSGIGLLTGVVAYNVAFGGLFALAFSLAYGRIGPYGARATAVLLALSAFIAVCLVPSLKYPAGPPSVGEAETIGIRTGLFFAMMVLSLAAMMGAWMLRKRLAARFGEWNAGLAAAGGYLVVVAAVSIVLPGVNEVPEGFPATVLWQFRIASLGANAIMWAILGIGFGAWAERALVASGYARAVRLA